MQTLVFYFLDSFLQISFILRVAFFVFIDLILFSFLNESALIFIISFIVEVIIFIQHEEKMYPFFADFQRITPKLHNQKHEKCLYVEFCVSFRHKKPSNLL